MRKTTRKEYEERIFKVQMHIQQNLDKPLGLDELAGIACFSPFHFHRIFSAMAGENIKEYIRRLRLERAALELKNTQKPITELALGSGYETHESFTRAFGRRFGMSPSEFRKNPLENPGAQKTLSAAAKRQWEERKMEVNIQEFETTTVAFVRHVGPYELCHAAWRKLCSDPEVLQCMGPETMVIGISYDDPGVTAPDKCRYDACVSVPDSCQPGKGVEKRKLEKCTCAVLTHKGPYDGLHACYQFLYGDWLPKSGYEPLSAPPMEIYRNNPETTPPEELVTDVCVPLETKGSP